MKILIIERNIIMDICDSCKRSVPIGLTDLVDMVNRSERLCPDCYNERMAELWGIDKPFSDFKPITLKDANGKLHTFHIITRLTTGLGMEAIEIMKNNKPKLYGYKFNILLHPETDSMEAFKLLYNRMKRGLGRKSIEYERNEHIHFVNEDDNTIIGRIEEENEEGTITFSIDGKKFTIDELIKLLGPYIDFNFKLTIYDSSEDIPIERRNELKDKFPWMEYHDD
jgi:hypothetical protein